MTDDDEWLTGPQLQKHFNVSAMAVWRWMHDRRLNFPAPVKIRQRNYWRIADVREFERRIVIAGLRDREVAA
jgi:predicted DNA-binding transcriptional regulator AlpA